MNKKPNNEWSDRARASIAQGALTNSKRPEAFIKGVFPSHVVRGEGAYLIDAWGNRYLDFCSGLGANLLGYAHPKIAEAVCKATNLGPSLSLPTVLEIEVAEKLCEITGFPKIRFFKEGSSATHAAIRIARAYKAMLKMQKNSGA